MVESDSEGRMRRCIYLPAATWAWVEATAEHDRSSRSDLIEGLILLAMDTAEASQTRRGRDDG